MPCIDSRDTPTMVQVRLKKSKCDQFGKGVSIILAWSYRRRGVPSISGILQYTAIRMNSPPGPFFVLSAGGTVTKQWFTTQIRATLQGLGLPQDQYAGHSFRIGAATMAALAGIPDSAIQTLGRWRSGIPAVHQDPAQPTGYVCQDPVGRHSPNCVWNSDPISYLILTFIANSLCFGDI